MHLLRFTHRRRLLADIAALTTHSSDLQRAKIRERQNVLQRRIDAWIEIQSLYMPAAMSCRQAEGSPESSHETPERTTLFMPSELPQSAACDRKLFQYEWRLRFAQALEILNDLRRHLRLRRSFRKIKDRFTRGVRANTRARGVVASIEETIKMDTQRYRHVRKALEALATRLGDKFGWDGELRELRDEDVREMQEDPNTDSEGRRMLSWIWKMPGVGSLDDSEGSQEGASLDVMHDQNKY